MEATRNLCAQIPASLHDRVREERESLGQSLSEYVTSTPTPAPTITTNTILTSTPLNTIPMY